MECHLLSTYSPHFLAGLPCGIYPGHSVPLSLAIPPWVGAVSTVDCFGYCWRRNGGKSCIVAGSAAWTAGMLIEISKMHCC